MRSNDFKNILGTTLLGLLILGTIFYGWRSVVASLLTLFYYGIFVGLIIGIVAGIALAIAGWLGSGQNQKLQQLTGGGFTLAAVSGIAVLLGRWFGV